MPLATDYDPLRHPPRAALANFYPFRPGEVAGPHWSESNLLLPVTHGTGRVEVGPRSFELSAGDLLHVPWAAPLRYAADRNDPFVVIGLHLTYAPWTDPAALRPLHTAGATDFGRESMQEAPTPQPWREPFVVVPSPDSRIFDAASELARAFEREDDPDREPRMRALALEILVELRAQRTGQAEHARHPRAGLVRGLASWLELSMARPITRAEIAARAGISESSLAAAFRAVTGRSPIDYLIELRLARARRLLASGNEPIARVGELVGIPDLFYFSKLFKRRHGVSPLAYRRRRRL